jgi:TolA-binding protein
VNEPEPVNATRSTSPIPGEGTSNGAAPTTKPEPEPEPQPEPQPEAVPAPSLPSTSATVLAAAPPSAKPSASAKPAPSIEATDADLALYKKAHQLHFVQHDHAAAFVAWNEYLAQFPGGTFVVEARYNRAVCLVKLGRNDEARAALKPFADGQVAGGYRQREAASLLELLDAKP